MIKIMTPGPTQVRENVRIKRSLETTNPDLDLEFYDFYKNTCKKISKILKTENESFIMSGEAILGLEAACASLTEKGDRVLVIDNGIFGRGFGDFVQIYGGEVVYFESEYNKPVEVKALAEYLKHDSDFKYATLVHCDTPSGVINDIKSICCLLNEYGILSIVDSVSGMFGEAIDVSNSKIDILCGGSQKALSAPIGLTFLTVSQSALLKMKSRKTPIASFYANILNFENYYTKKWFPYSMPISDIYGLDQALDNVINDGEFVQRHEKIALATRKAIESSGLKLYLESGYSNTITAVEVPTTLNSDDILNTMKSKYNVMIAGCFGCFEGKVFRLGHMGENANVKDMCLVFEALQKTFEDLHYNLRSNLKEEFLKNI